MHPAARPSFSRFLCLASGSGWRLATLALAACLFAWPLAGCSGPPLVKPPDADLPPAAEQKMPERLDIHVYLDASLSMQGFSTAEGSSTTTFARTLERIDNSRLLLPDTTLTFHRFGAQRSGGGANQPSQHNLETIRDRDFRQAFRKPFYTDPRFTADNFLDLVVKDSPPKAVNIIVSDLFQADADITRLSASLQTRMAAGASVAVLALESPFAGTVYDIGSQHIKLDYNGPRPFFALVFGPAVAVQTYGELLRGELEKDSVSCRLLQLSTKVVTQPLGFAHSTPGELVNADFVTLLAQEDRRVAQLRLQPGAGAGSFTCDFPWEKARSEMSFDAARLRTAVVAKRWDKDDWQDDANAAEALTVTSSEAPPPAASPSPGDPPAKPALRLAFRLDPAHLPGPAVYRFDCTPGLEAADFRPPDWVARADMDTSHISEWQRNPSLYHGSVLNLRHFIDEVWLETCHQHPPQLGKLYLYVQISG